MANTRGRQPIGINQPPGGGLKYPFVEPSIDIKYLFTDLFLSFDDIEDSFTFPLKVKWLYGFGDNLVSPPAGYPTPTHSYDIIISDAEDNTVFDSTEAGTYYTSDWDSRLKIIEWQSTDSILRCVIHTDWTQSDIADALNLTYDNYIEPANGELQQDTYYKLPKRVKSIQVGLTNIKGKSIKIQEGYNVALAAESTLAVPELNVPSIFGEVNDAGATRLSNPITINAAPGEGLGVFPGCTGSSPVIRTFNRIPSNEYQNFTWDGEGCIRYQRPVGLISLTPRLLQYSSLSIPLGETPSAIEVLNDCKNCCDCMYFARTYQGIKRQWSLYKNVGIAAERARDFHSLNITKWEGRLSELQGNSLRIRLRKDYDSKISWGIALCNSTECCFHDFNFVLVWLYYKNGTWYEPSGDNAVYVCPGAEIDGSPQCNGAEIVAVETNSASGLVTTINCEYTDPGTTTFVSGRSCFPEAEGLDPDELRVKLGVFVNVNSEADTSIFGDQCWNYFEAIEDLDPDVIAALSSTGSPIPSNIIASGVSEIISVDSRSAFCRSCDCE